MTRSLLSLTAGLLLAAGAALAQTPLQVRDAWARPTVPGQSTGGGYLKLQSATADRLVGGSSPVAERLELHSMNMEGDVMRMRQVEAVELPAGATVELRPGGLHLMLLGLKAPLKAGERVPLVLRFEKAGEVRTELVVGSGAGGGGAPAHGHEHSHGHGHKH